MRYFLFWKRSLPMIMNGNSQAPEFLLRIQKGEAYRSSNYLQIITARRKFLIR